jgi:hypothetical protein
MCNKSCAKAWEGRETHIRNKEITEHVENAKHANNQHCNV